MEISIIKAGRKHLPMIRELYEQFVEDELQACNVPAQHRITMEIRKARVQEILNQFSNPFRTWLVAVAGDDVVGSLIMTEKNNFLLNEKSARVDILVVARKARRHGVARALMYQAEKLALSLGCCYLWLDVLEGNGPAFDLYEKEGYAPKMRTLYKRIK